MARFTAYFKDNSTFSLYGEDYFGDKAVFSEHHFSNLEYFCKEVVKKKRPFKVVDEYTKQEILFKSNTEFDRWYRKYQCGEPNFES